MFFISAREALLSRNADPTSSPRGGFSEGNKGLKLKLKNIVILGYQERLDEFSKFEREFEECISKTAVQTKFEQHTNRGKEIVALIRETTANIANKSHTLKQESVYKLKDMNHRHDLLEHELCSMTESSKEKIRHVSEDVYKRVAQTLNDEIKRYVLNENEEKKEPIYNRRQMSLR